MSRLDKLTKLLDLDPKDPFVLYGIAQEHARAGRTSDAVAFFDRCLAADPSYAYAYYHKARALQAGGLEVDALATARAGLAAAGGDGKAQGELAALVDELS
jgi:tetratricopeptide (TPR) repeat protein